MAEEKDNNGRKTVWAGILGSLAVAITAWVPNLAGWIDSVAAKNNAQAAALLAAENQVDNADEHREMRSLFQEGLDQCVSKEELRTALQQVEDQISKRHRNYEPVARSLEEMPPAGSSVVEQVKRKLRPPDPPSPRGTKAERVQEILQQKGLVGPGPK